MDFCRSCRVPIEQSPIGRRRQFCSTACRNRVHGRIRWLREQQPWLTREVAQWRRKLEGTKRRADRVFVTNRLTLYEQQLARVVAELAVLDRAGVNSEEMVR